MILTELGLHFVKDGDRWPCVERPELVMLRGDGLCRAGDRIFGSRH
jgi:hypothetical protein